MVVLDDDGRPRLVPHLLCFILGYLAGTGDLVRVLIG